MKMKTDKKVKSVGTDPIAEIGTKEYPEDGVEIGYNDEVTIMDKLKEENIEKSQLYPEGGKNSEEGVDPKRPKTNKIPVIVFVDDSHKSKLMVQELNERGIFDILT